MNNRVCRLCGKEFKSNLRLTQFCSDKCCSNLYAAKGISEELKWEIINSICKEIIEYDNKRCL